MNFPEEHLPDEPLPGSHLPEVHAPGTHAPEARRTPWAVGTGVSGSLQSLLGTVVIAVFVITFIVQAFQIPSPSMENTL
ncbi:MAG: hypothetical protein WCA20_14050, partial [Candidatus Sulfotelmatobacter sp.]